MIRAIVKGSYVDAENAAANQGITIIGTMDWPHEEEAIIKVAEREFQDMLNWFCEPLGNPPFPAGTLLWFSGLDGGATR